MNAIEFDTSKLPRKPLVDTNVFLRYLGEKPDDPRTPICVAICKAVVESGRELYVAAPSIAEIIRYRSQPVPRVRGIVVVPFDDRAAELLGLHMPMAKIHQSSLESGLSKTYLKYDALIVACALRVGADAIVSYDTSDHEALTKSTRLAVFKPEHFRRQDLLNPAPSLATPQPDRTS